MQDGSGSTRNDGIHLCSLQDIVMEAYLDLMMLSLSASYGQVLVSAAGI